MEQDSDLVEKCRSNINKYIKSDQRKADFIISFVGIAGTLMQIMVKNKDFLKHSIDDNVLYLYSITATAVLAIAYGADKGLEFVDMGKVDYPDRKKFLLILKNLIAEYGDEVKALENEESL